MGTTANKTAYNEKMQGLLRDAEAEANKLEAEIDKAKADARASHQQHLQELRSKMAATETKLDKLRSADEAQWEKTQAEVERSWNDVKQSFQKFASQVRTG
jgi:hypothetical protein